jgi:hypothetical protein
MLLPSPFSYASATFCDSLRLFAKATDVIGDETLARQWMQTPREAFAGKTPFDMARTELGAREVEELLQDFDDGAVASDQRRRPSLAPLLDGQCLNPPTQLR